MKQILAVVYLMVCMMGWANLASARDTCGGNIEYGRDCDNNDRHYHISCCPQGYRVHGIAYSDLPNQDHVDAITALCRNVKAGNTMVPPSERSHQHLSRMECDKTEVVSGLISQDVKTNSGNRRDSLDGATVECLNPKTGAKRVVYSSDINSARPGKTYSLNTEVVGWAYKELDKGTSDRVDCVVPITRPRR